MSTSLLNVLFDENDPNALFWRWSVCIRQCPEFSVAMEIPDDTNDNKVAQYTAMHVSQSIILRDLTRGIDCELVLSSLESVNRKLIIKSKKLKTEFIKQLQEKEQTSQNKKVNDEIKKDCADSNYDYTYNNDKRVKLLVHKGMEIYFKQVINDMYRTCLLNPKQSTDKYTMKQNQFIRLSTSKISVPILLELVPCISNWKRLLQSGKDSGMAMKINKISLLNFIQFIAVNTRMSSIFKEMFTAKEWITWFNKYLNKELKGRNDDEPDKEALDQFKQVRIKRNFLIFPTSQNFLV